MISNVVEGQDSDELEALFDSIVSANQGAGNLEPQPPVTSHQPTDHGKVIGRIGHLARTLHDALCELDHDMSLEKAMPAIPDAGDRLGYVTNTIEKNTERVLNAADAAQPIVEKIEVGSRRLAREWQRLFDKQLDAEQFKGLVMQTRAFLADVPIQTKATNACLMEIMMAQDTQDITGQAIKKAVAMMRQTEKQLLELLTENSPSAANPDAAAGRDQVDELLGSLGF